MNGAQFFVNPATGDLIDTAWTAQDLNISAIADNNPIVKIRFTLTTDGGAEFGGWNIDDLHVGTMTSGDVSPLAASEIFMRASLGGTLMLDLDGTPAAGGRTYVVGASVSGTSPGIPLGSVVLPLNWDFLTAYAFANLNNQIFGNFYGVLDGQGRAQASFLAPPISDPAIIGVTIHFAWITLNPIDFASNPVGLLFVP